MTWEDSSRLTYGEIERREHEYNIPDWEDTLTGTREEYEEKRRDCIENCRDWND